MHPLKTLLRVESANQTNLEILGLNERLHNFVLMENLQVLLIINDTSELKRPKTSLMKIFNLILGLITYLIFIVFKFINFNSYN